MKSSIIATLRILYHKSLKSETFSEKTADNFQIDLSLLFIFWVGKLFPNSFEQRGQNRNSQAVAKNFEEVEAG